MLLGIYTGVLFILMHLLSKYLYFIGGYIVIIIICLSFFVTYVYMYNVKNNFNFILYYISAIYVLICSLLINGIFVYFYYYKNIDFRAFLILILLWLILNFILLNIFKLYIKFFK